MKNWMTKEERNLWLGQMLREKVLADNGRYDENEHMLTVEQKKWAGGYHTRRTGILHPLRDAAEYADAIFQGGMEELFGRGEQVIRRICSLQDAKEGSRTYGLWSYYLEENLDDMIAPDYNWADFISKCLLGIRILASDRVTAETKEIMDAAIRRAAMCSIRRNVGLDYTNIALMSSMTILSAGELLQDKAIFEAGKERLEKLYAYTKFNGAFSEYNSSAYVLVALNEIARMKRFFKDSRCRFLAEELNGYAWDGLSNHYNAWIGQLTPPQARAYVNLDTGALAWNVYLGTDGRYGAVPRQDGQILLSAISVESLLYPPECPQKFFPRFEEKERFLAHTYYKKNCLREEGTDTTIIRDLDHPDLTAYSYQTQDYSMGIFQASDCWNQRRNAMVVWGREKPSYMRLRGMIGDYDFCSGMVYGYQKENVIYGHLGLVSDRGSFHYILDKVKNGIYETDRLYFQFEIGDREDLRFAPICGGYEIRDQGIVITVRIHTFIYDGKPGQIRLSEDERRLLLIGYEGEKTVIDTNALNDTYGVFSIQVRKEEEQAAEAPQAAVRLSQGILTSSGVWGQTPWKLESPVWTAPFLEASRIASEGREAAVIEKIMDKMQHMENEGDVVETCPISIISMNAWEWPQGVALFAMYQYYRETGEKKVWEFLENWFDRQIQKGLPSQNVNTTCPMLTLACLYEEKQKESWRQLLEEWAEGVYARMPRAGEGAIQHVVSGEENLGQIWDDTLYMAVLFLAKMGEVLGREEYIQESIRQFMVHIKYLTDRKSGLFYHGWTFLGKNHLGEALWGRGNSWYTAGLVDYLELLKENEGVRAVLLDTLQVQVSALADCQDASGLWHTLLDDKDSYLETSASCAFAYGILKAVRMGYLEEKFEAVGKRAVQGVLDQIAPDGTVEGVSYGTPVFADKEEYKKIPVCPMPYGQSMALMMLVEARKHR